jgi:hypothetical protein
MKELYGISLEKEDGTLINIRIEVEDGKAIASDGLPLEKISMITLPALEGCEGGARTTLLRLKLGGL